MSSDPSDLPPLHRPLALRLAARARALPDFRGRDRLIATLMRQPSCYPDAERVVEFGGLRARGNPHATPYLSVLATFRHSAPALGPVLDAALGPGDCFADVGGNAGLYALWGARRVGTSGEVHCFEPIPESIAAIRGNARLNGFEQITVHEVAVGDEERTLSLYMNPQHLGVASGFRHGEEIGFEEREIQVQAVRLENAFASLRSPAIVKIDVEGMETHVLRGAAGLLARSDGPAVVFETGEEDRAGTTFGELVGWLEDEFGLQTHALTPEGLALQNRAQTAAGSMNVLALHPERHRALFEALRTTRFRRNQNN